MRRVLLGLPFCLPYSRRSPAFTTCTHVQYIQHHSLHIHPLDAVRRRHAWPLLLRPTNLEIRAARCSPKRLRHTWRRCSPRSTPILTPEASSPTWNVNSTTICSAVSWPRSVFLSYHS